MNKRGDITITIFVIGVLAICTLAIFSFYFSDRNVKNSFNSIETIEKVLVTKEKISLYNESFEFTQEEIEELFNIKEDIHTKEKYIISQQFVFSKKGSLSVRYNLPR